MIVRVRNGTLDSVSINSSADNRKEQSWREGFIAKQVSQSVVKPVTVAITAGEISGKWYGTYSFTTKDSIVYHAEGYQIDRAYKLSGNERDGALMLDYLSAADHTESAVLEKTKDFGTVVNENKSYTWSSPYLDLSFGCGKSKVYILKKKIEEIFLYSRKAR